MTTDLNHGQSEGIRINPGTIKKVAIIGGGASGAIALDSLLQEQKFEEIVLFERREILGGIWVLDEKPDVAVLKLVKAGSTGSSIDPPLANPFHDCPESKAIRLLNSHQERFIETPAYQGMATNIIENLMTFSDQKLWVKGETNRYVDRSGVQKYILRYIEKNKDKEGVRLVLGTTVEDVEKVPALNGAPYQFKLTLRKTLSDGTDLWTQEIFDSVVVTVGHYHVPFIPDVPGLREAQEAFPDRIQHSKFFRDGSAYKDKTVVVVGSRALGADLTKFSADHATKVYQLIRNLANTRRFNRRTNVETKPLIKKYEVSGDRILVHFEDGTVVSPHYVLYATGFQFLFPFLNTTYGNITKDGAIVPNLYQHTFLVDEPYLAFVGIPTDAISFRAFEYQAILVARYLSGRVALPSKEQQQQWLDTRLREKGVTRAFHTIGALDALQFSKTLSELGKTEEVEGRQFPELSEEEVAEYKAAGEVLAEFWDSPRIPETQRHLLLKQVPSVQPELVVA